MKHATFQISTLCLIVLLPVFAIRCLAQAPEAKEQSNDLQKAIEAGRKSVGPLFGKVPMAAFWTVEEWNGNGKPYQTCRQEVDTRLADDKDSAQFQLLCKAEAEKKPLDPIVVYRWAYVSYKMSRLKGQEDKEQIKKKQKMMEGVEEALEAPLSPRNYEYARLRFLVSARPGALDVMKHVGERLLLHTPKDYDVKFALVRILMGSVTQSDHQKALRYAQEMVEQEPQKPSAYINLAQVHHHWWYYKKEDSDAKAAVNAYQQFLTIAPKDHYWRETALRKVTQLSTAMQGKR